MRRLLIAITALSLACGGGDASTGPASASIAGAYSLRTVNGTALPYTIAIGSASATLTADVVTLTDGGTWSEQYTYKQNNQTQTGSDGGTIVRAGTGITLMSGTATAYSGTVSSGTLTVSDGLATYVFVR